MIIHCFRLPVNLFVLQIGNHSQHYNECQQGGKAELELRSDFKIFHIHTTSDAE
jgi:hypothetical protein